MSKQKKCKQCKELFEPQRPLQYLCSPFCAYEYAKNNVKKRVEKSIKKESKGIKEALMTKSEWLGLAQKVFNAYIRLRDKDENCISCGKTSNRYDAGHFYSAGNHSYLRFDEDNVHKQCSYNCNKMLHGNLHEYRKALIKKIGLKRVEILDRDCHKPLNLTIDEIKEIIKIYRKKVAELKK